ncbi:MAG: hypothetical protein VW338_00095 [Rhodospirillaceae bacterium]
MTTDTLEFPYYQRLGGGWTLAEIECRVRIPTYNHADWEVDVMAYRDRQDQEPWYTWRNIDRSPETAVQELRAGIIWHVEETMQNEIEGCVKAFRKATAARQKADSRETV